MKRLAPRVAIGVLALITVATVWFYPTPTGSASADLVVVKGDIVQRVMIAGNLWPDRRAAIWPQVPGRVTRVLVRRGDTVREGQPLFLLDETQARSDLSRYKLLLEKAEVTAETRDSVRETRTAAIDVKLAQREVREVQRRLDSSTVRSTISGVILHVGISEGDYSSIGGQATSPPVVVGSTESFVVEGEADDFQAVQINSGAPALVFVEGAGAAPLQGVVHDQPMLKRFSSGPSMPSLFGVRIDLSEPPPSRYIGMSCRIEITVAKKTQVSLVPAEAISVSGTETFVFAKGAGGVVRTPVKTGAADGGAVELLEGPPVGTLLVRPAAVGAR